MLGGTYPSIVSAMSKMCAAGKIVEPEKGVLGEKVKNYHNAKFHVFLKMYDHGLEYREVMSSF